MSNYFYWKRRSNPRIYDPKKKLHQLFASYSNEDGQLNKEQLKNAFEHLDAAMPNKHAQEALNVADSNDDGLISFGTQEFNNLVDYAYNKGFGSSI